MVAKQNICNIIIDQGTTFNPVLTWKNEDNTLVNLTGYTAKMQGRNTVSSPVTLFNLTTENGGITLGGVLGTISLFMSAAQTTALISNGVYDLKLISAGGLVTRLLQGTITLSTEVTR